MSDIFISYASEDRSRAEPIAKALEEYGWSVFWDRIISVGKTWDDVIEEEIDAAKCIIVIWTDISVASGWVRSEAEEGLRRNILIPVQIDNAKIPLRFRSIQAADLTEWDLKIDHSGFTILLDAISGIAGPSPLKVKEEEEKRAEATRKSEEARQKKEAEAKRKAEEEQKVKEAKAEIKPGKPEPDQVKPTEPPKRSIAIKFSVLAGVVVLLITGIWLYYNNQEEQHKKDARIKLGQFYEQVEELERSAAKVDNQEQLKGLYMQKDKLSDQVAAFSEQVATVVLRPQLEQLRDRLKKFDAQLANKEKELTAGLKGRIFVVSAPDNATVKILNIDESFQQGMELKPGKYHVEVSSEGYEPQDRWIELGPSEEKEINFELVKIIQKVARLFVEPIPKDATVRILNIRPKFSQGMELEPGSYHVEVAAEGYETERRWIDLVAGHEEPYKFGLEKIPPKVGRIFVESVPVKATVKILNIDQGFRQGMEIEPGKYHVQASLTGYYPQDRWVEISSGEEKQLAFELIRHKVITNSIGMKFVLIPAGSFTMGSQLSPEKVALKFGGPAKYYKNEQPPHPVKITKPFYLQTTEITEAQCEKILGYKLKGWGEDRPMAAMWTEAYEVINKLNEMEGTNKYRLPTEAEWEYACRAGTTTVFSFGNEADKLGEYAWYSGNSVEKAKPVGRKKPNAWGLYDMHGNVWEWCHDWYGDYPSNPVVDPKGPETGKYRVYRGGVVGLKALHLRSAARFRNYPDYRDPFIGFRVARDF